MTRFGHTLNYVINTFVKHIPDVSRVVIFSGMHRKVNSVIIQRCSTTRLVNQPQNAFSIGAGVCITPTNACVFC